MKFCFALLLLLSCFYRTNAQTAQAQSTSAQSTSAQTTSVSEVRPAGAAALALPAEKQNPVRLPRFDEAPAIDGNLDEKVWGGATVLKDFYQVQPGDNIAPSQATEVLLGYDAKFLYIGFRAHDQPGKVRATIAKRDAIQNDDYVMVYLDTYNDKRRAYQLSFNPLGVQQDCILTEGSGEDCSVDILMESRGVVNEQGYVVEIKIPFKSLRFEAGKDKLWGVHFFRRIKRYNNELDSWMPISRENSSTLNQEGHITGLEELSGERTLEVVPTLTLAETGTRARTLSPASPEFPDGPFVVGPGRFVNKPVEMDPGVTVKLGITSTITLNFALNPDFAEVEADRTVVRANQRFPIFFQEKRPFFLEGIDIFQTRLSAVHTRAIIDPDVAVKLSGKSGRNSFGVLYASDRAPGNFSAEERLDPVNKPFLDKNASIGVLRFKRDIGKENNLGVIATSYNFVQKHNQLGGVDGRFRLGPITTFEFQALGSTSRRFFYDPVQDRSIYRTGNGFAYQTNFNRSGRNWVFNLSGEGRTRDFRADVGFVQRLNNNAWDIYLNYSSDPDPKARLISWRVFNSNRPNFDWKGRSQNWENETQATLNFPAQTSVGVGYLFGYERLFEEEFGPKRTAMHPGAFIGPDSERSAYKRIIYAFADTTPNKKYSAAINVSQSFGVFDFDFGAGPRFPRVSPAALLDQNAPLDPGPGDALNISAVFTYQPTDALRTSINYIKSRLVRDDTGRVAFDDNIFTLRTTYQFTRFTFARGRVDYDTLLSNVRAQLLFGWTPNPGTSFYVGYNDDLNRNGFNPFTGETEPGFRRNGRTFFIKMSYLFRRNL